MATSGRRANFHFDNGHHKLRDGEAATDLMVGRSRQIVNEENENVRTFSDWGFYQELKRQPGCVKVEVSQVHVDHSSWFLTGLQVVYKSTFSDGRKDVETEAPVHPFQRFRYQQYGQSTRSTLELADNEYITNCTFRRVDKISDRVTFQTNLRTVSFGSPAFSSFHQKWLLPNPEPQSDKASQHLDKVVAFAGITCEMSENMGCFSESQNWMRIKDVVLLRHLVAQDRAIPLQTAQPQNDTDSILQALVMDTNQDVFRRVLSHLLP